MSLAVAIDLKDAASPVVRAIARGVRPERLNPIVGRAATNAIRAHLFAHNGRKANALGGTRTNYYASAARGLHSDTVPSIGTLISINQVGFRLQVFGGTVRPVTKKFLTIPARAEAHGKRAGEFNDLVIIFGRGGRPIALARAGQSLIGFRKDGVTRAVVGVSRKGTAGGEILFWLVDSVTVRPDPGILPEDKALIAAVDTAVKSYLDRQLERAGDLN